MHWGMGVVALLRFWVGRALSMRACTDARVHPPAPRCADHQPRAAAEKREPCHAQTARQEAHCGRPGCGASPSPLRASSATWPAPAAHASRRGAGGEGLAATCHTHRCVSVGLIPACARSSPRQVMEERMIEFAWTLVDWRTFDSVGRALCCTPLPLPHLPIAPLTRPNAVEPAADVPGLQPHCHAKRSKRKVSNMPLSWQG